MTSTPATRTVPPKLLLTMIIFSVVIGVVSITASLFTAGIWEKFYRGSLPRSEDPPSLKPPPDPAEFPASTGETMRADGLGSVDRQKIIDAIPDEANVTPAGLEMFNRSLGEYGRKIYPDPNAAHFKLPQKREGFNTRPGEWHLYSNHGMLTLHENEAYYTISSGPHLEVSGSLAFEPAGGVPVQCWSVVAVDEAIKQLRGKLQAVTDLQAGFVAGKLAKQSAAYLVSPDDPDPKPMTVPISDASLVSGNVLSVTAGTRGYFVLADGRGIDKFSEPLGLDPVTGRPLTLSAPGSAFIPLLPGNPQLMRALYFYCLAVLVPAFFLIIAGVMLAVRPVLGLKMHKAYALVKFLFIATEIALSVNYFITVSDAGNSARTPFDIDAGTRGLIQTVLMQSIYPIVILLVLSGEEVRSYLAAQKGTDKGPEV